MALHCVSKKCQLWQAVVSTSMECLHNVFNAVILAKLTYAVGPASVALSVVSQYALPGYGDRRDRVRGPAGPIIVSGYSGVCFEIKFSGTHRGFDGVLFNL